MSTLIIPAAGKSSRFNAARPKWMLTHPTGQLMIQMCISDEMISNFDNVIISINPNHVKQHEADLWLSQAINSSQFKDKIKYYICPHETHSAAETVYLTIKNNQVKGSICIKDCDNYFSYKHKANSSYIVGLNIEKTEVRDVGGKSFISVNEFNQISDIKEKKIVSNMICVGAYCFSNADTFINIYEDITNSPLLLSDGEIYVSHIFSLAIKNGESIDYIECSDYKDWGIPEAWEDECKKYKTYFLDIDGVITKNVGKFGSKNWHTDNEYIEENVNKLKEISKLGCQIILTSARDEASVKRVKKDLEKLNIKIHSIIFNCFHAKRIIINDFAQTNPYPSCEAVNIARNSSIDFL